MIRKYQYTRSVKNSQLLLAAKSFFMHPSLEISFTGQYLVNNNVYWSFVLESVTRLVNIKWKRPLNIRYIINFS